MKFTFHDVHAAGIRALGGVEEACRTKRYRQFRVERPNQDTVWDWVGQRDGLRWGRRPAVSESMGACGVIRSVVFKRGRELLARENPNCYWQFPAFCVPA